MLDIEGSKTDAIWPYRTTLFWCPKPNLSFHFFWICSHYYWLAQSLAETLKVYLDAASQVKIVSDSLMWALPHVSTPLPSCPLSLCFQGILSLSPQGLPTSPLIFGLITLHPESFSLVQFWLSWFLLKTSYSSLLTMEEGLKPLARLLKVLADLVPTYVSIIFWFLHLSLLSLHL